MCREYTFYCYCGHVYRKTTIPCEHWTSAIYYTKIRDDDDVKNPSNPLDRIGRASRTLSKFSSSSSSSSSFLSLVSFKTMSNSTTSSRSLSPAISPLTVPTRSSKKTTDATTTSSMPTNKQCSWSIPIPRLFPKLCSDCESISHISEYLAQSPTKRLEIIRDWRTANEAAAIGEWPVETDARLPGRRDSYGNSLLYFWAGKRARAQAFARARKVAAKALSARAGVEVDGLCFGALPKEKDELRLVVEEENAMHRDHLGAPLGDSHLTAEEDLEVGRRVPGWNEAWEKVLLSL